VDRRLLDAMREGYRHMVEFSGRHHCNYRLACYGVALERLMAVYKERQIFP
jgi:glutamate dehydrogenase (NAD(P)+)